MIAKSTLIQLIKEVLAENPGLLAGSGPTDTLPPNTRPANSRPVNSGPAGSRSASPAPAETFAPLVELASLAESRSQPEVARHLLLAVEAEGLPPAVSEMFRDLLEPYRYTKGELEQLASELEERLRAPYHAAYVREVLERFARNHCLRREPGI